MRYKSTNIFPTPFCLPPTLVVFSYSLVYTGGSQHPLHLLSSIRSYWFFYRLQRSLPFQLRFLLFFFFFILTLWVFLFVCSFLSNIPPPSLNLFYLFWILFLPLSLAFLNELVKQQPNLLKYTHTEKMKNANKYLQNKIYFSVKLLTDRFYCSTIRSCDRLRFLNTRFSHVSFPM